MKFGEHWGIRESFIIPSVRLAFFLWALALALHTNCGPFVGALDFLPKTVLHEMKYETKFTTTVLLYGY